MEKEVGELILSKVKEAKKLLETVLDQWEVDPWGVEKLRTRVKRAKESGNHDGLWDKSSSSDSESVDTSISVKVETVESKKAGAGSSKMEMEVDEEKRTPPRRTFPPPSAKKRKIEYKQEPSPPPRPVPLNETIPKLAFGPFNKNFNDFSLRFEGGDIKIYNHGIHLYTLYGKHLQDRPPLTELKAEKFAVDFNRYGDVIITYDNDNFYTVPKKFLK